jgi:hypothetical protein
MAFPIWTEAFYSLDPNAPDVEWFWMPMDPTGPKPMHRMNPTTAREDQERERQELLEIVMDYAW